MVVVLGLLARRGVAAALGADAPLGAGRRRSGANCAPRAVAVCRATVGRALLLLRRPARGDHRRLVDVVFDDALALLEVGAPELVQFEVEQ